MLIVCMLYSITEATFLFLPIEWGLPGASLVSQLLGSLFAWVFGYISVVLLCKVKYPAAVLLLLGTEPSSARVEMKILLALPRYIWGICRRV